MKHLPVDSSHPATSPGEPRWTSGGPFRPQDRGCAWPRGRKAAGSGARGPTSGPGPGLCLEEGGSSEVSLCPTRTRDWGKGHHGGARHPRLRVAGHRCVTLTPVWEPWPQGLRESHARGGRGQGSWVEKQSAVLEEGLANRRPTPAAPGPPPAATRCAREAPRSTRPAATGRWHDPPFKYRLRGLREKSEDADQARRRKGPSNPTPRRRPTTSPFRHVPRFLLVSVSVRRGTPHTELPVGHVTQHGLKTQRGRAQRRSRTQ